MGEDFAAVRFNNLALELLNNRELATVVWLSVVAVTCLFNKKLRASLGPVRSSLLEPWVLAAFSSVGIYVALLIWLGHRVGLWSAELISETVWWFVGTGLVLLFHIDDSHKERGFFRRIALQTFSITLLLEFLMNDLFVLRLPFELLLVPILTVLTMVSVVAQADPDQRQVASLTGWLQAAIGFGIATFVVSRILTNWDQVATEAHLLELLLPVWLTLGFLPLLYVIAVLMFYDSAFRRVEWTLGDQQRGSWRVKFALVSVLRGRTRDTAGFGGAWVTDAASARSLRDARNVVKRYRASRRRREEAEKEARDRLERYVGVEGTDNNGFQLDRREFSATTAALRSLATAQMGWYRNPGSRYRADLLELFAPIFESDGLPAEHGITMHVSGDGQAWYARRRTVTGWCFAIGASAPPPDQWEFDGPEPPVGFPGQDGAWGNHPFTLEVNPNWDEP